MILQHYIDKIRIINSLIGLDKLLEKAAYDDELTNAEYNDVYELALFKAKQWQPI